MATIKNLVTGELVELRVHHLIGRKSGAVDTFLSSPDVSQMHSTIKWNGAEWSVEDFSRNGTWMDHKKLVPRQAYTMKNGSVIRFGKKNESCWEVVDLMPPVASLEKVSDSGVIIELEDSMLIPGQEIPAASIFKDGLGNWLCDIDGDINPLENNQIVNINNEMWRFYSDQPHYLTKNYEGEHLSSGTVAIFNTSLDEEHVSLTLKNKEAVFDLGERIHHYLLLVLARKRIEDRNAGLDSLTQGWIETSELVQMLGIDESHANIQVYRARQQVMKAVSLKDLKTNIVERRNGSLRFGLQNIQIIRGALIESDSISLENSQMMTA
ncbi:MAG: FHA domain-containing protein [Marinobacterium sp.]|nr:FHA domain-containing protein [Marinobacterium sp.]